MTHTPTPPWQQPPPRDDAQVRALCRGARGYNWFGAIMATVVVGVPLLVGLSSRVGERLSTFVGGLLLTGLLFGVPTALFVGVNLRTLRRLARDGVECPATVDRFVPQGPNHPAELVATFVLPDGTHASTTVHTLAIQPGTALTVLWDPARPGVAGVVLPSGDMAVGRVVRA